VGVRSHVVHETALEQSHGEVVHGLPEAPRHRAGRDRREDAAIHDTLHPVEVAEEARRPFGVGEKRTQSSNLRLEQRSLEELARVRVRRLDQYVGTPAQADDVQSRVVDLEQRRDGHLAPRDRIEGNPFLHEPRVEILDRRQDPSRIERVVPVDVRAWPRAWPCPRSPPCARA